MNKLNINEIIKVDFPENQYYKIETKKNQIVLHHTVSGKKVIGDIEFWKSTPERVSTSIIIDSEGKIYQTFSSKYWSHHLGTKEKNNKELNMGSIGIEIDSWGGLVKHTDNNYYPAIWNGNKMIPNLKLSKVDNVCVLDKPFRGFTAFEKYTDEQIESVGKLLVFWNEKYNIPLSYNSDMWDLSKKALSGVSGVWTHVSYRKDKSDCYPDDRLIKMLKSL